MDSGEVAAHEAWRTPRQSRRQGIRSLLLGEDKGDDFQPQPFGDKASIEVLVRLPFALPTDDRLHVFPLPATYDPAHSSVHWRELGPPFVQLRTVSISAPWTQLVRPGLFEGLGELVGDALPERESPSDTLDSPSPDGAVDTWASIISPAAALVGDDADPVESVLERGLYGINRLIRALRLLNHNSRPTTLAIEDLELLVFWRVLDPEGAGQSPLSMLPLTLDSSRFSQPLTQQENDQLDGLINMQGQGHTFLTYRDWFERARHAREHRGDTVAAVVSLQTAIESLLVNVLYMTLVDDGVPATTLTEFRENPPTFKTLLTKSLRDSLGGAWDITRGPVGRYWDGLYRLRNRTTHAGYVPTYAEMETAFGAYEEFMDHLVARLRANSVKYPRTFIALLGIDGVTRRGWMTRRLTEVTDAFAEEEEPFWWPADAAGRAD